MAILVLIEEIKDIRCLLSWGQRFARARDCSLIIAHAVQVRNGTRSEHVPLLPDNNDGSIGIQAIRRFLDDDRSDQLDDSTDSDSSTHRSQIPKLWDINHAKPQQAALQLIEQFQCNLCMLVKKQHTRHSEVEDLSSQLLHSAHCDVMLFRPALEAHENTSKRIIIPAAGGPHTIAALQLADTVARNEGMILSPFYVQNPASGDAEAVARFHLSEILKNAGITDAAHIHNTSVVSNDIRESINHIAQEDCKLLIIGASDHHAVARLLFGTLDAKIMTGSQQVSIAVIRRARPVHSRMRMSFETFASSRIPQLDREQRIELAERLHNGSICNFDYLALICLSTLIAALGLIQNATAVVVGAMLVAPLMTPIIGAGLGLVQGNAQLIRSACKSIGYGFIVALGIGLLLGLLIPNATMNNELSGRGNPNAIDLFIALFSGIAAAYAMSRPNLSAALPGVAIAAALVPPIATVGISLALGDIANAEGAVLLFGTNVVAIILGAAIVLHIVGMRPAQGDRVSRLWVQRLILSLIISIIIFAVPLSSIYLAKLGHNETKNIEHNIQQHFSAFENTHIHNIRSQENDQNGIDIYIQVLSPTKIPHNSIETLRNTLQQQFSCDINIEVITIPVNILQAGTSSSN